MGRPSLVEGIDRLLAIRLMNLSAPSGVIAIIDRIFPQGAILLLPRIVFRTQVSFKAHRRFDTLHPDTPSDGPDRMDISLWAIGMVSFLSGAQQSPMCTAGRCFMCPARRGVPRDLRVFLRRFDPELDILD
jgi:hypothetical protein